MAKKARTVPSTPRRGPPDRHRSMLITWSCFEPTRPLPGLDEILLRQAPPDLTDQSIALRVEHLLRSDLTRSWRLGAVAHELGVSTRTRQRRLRTERRPFTRILSQTRIDVAMTMLRTDDRTVTNVGYLTGFADTAHFTRTFKATTGLTPSEWTAANRTQQAR